MKLDIKTFLLKNIGVRQTILKNTFWLTIAEIITRVLGLVVIVGMARILGVAEYGKFAFALSFVSLFAVFSDLGVSEISIRELSKGEESEKEYSSILSLKIILSIGALILMILGSFFITPDLVVRKAVWLLAVFITINQFFYIITAFLRARQKMEYEAVVNIFQALIVTGFVLFVLLVFPSVENLSFIYFFADLIVVIALLFFFHFYIKPLKLSYDKAVWKKFLKASWPLTFGLGLGWIYGYIDSIMLGHFGLLKETGWYNAVSKIAIVTVTPAILINKSFYPILSKFFFLSQELLNRGKEMFQRVWNYYLEATIVLALPIMIGGWVLAPKIINLLYGVNYQPATLAFQLLIVVAGISFFYYPYGLILVVVHHQKKNFFLIAIGAIINIILNLLLIKNYSLYGVAAATVISSGIVFLLAIDFSRRFAFISVFNLRLFRTLIISILSCLAMLLTIWQLLIPNLNVVLIIIIGGLVYSAVFLVFYKIFNKKIKNES